MSKTKKSKELLTKLLETDLNFKDQNGNIIEVPKSGNLGLLAIGYKGIVAVRKKRNELKKK